MVGRAGKRQAGRGAAWDTTSREELITDVSSPGAADGARGSGAVVI
jgi:hypothetical protein